MEIIKVTRQNLRDWWEYLILLKSEDTSEPVPEDESVAN